MGKEEERKNILIWSSFHLKTEAVVDDLNPYNCLQRGKMAIEWEKKWNEICIVRYFSVKKTYFDFTLSIYVFCGLVYVNYRNLISQKTWKTTDLGKVFVLCFWKEKNNTRWILK